MESDAALSYPPRRALRRGWLSGVQARPLVVAAYGLSGLLTVTAVMLGSSPSLSGPLGPASPLVLALLAVNFVLIIALAIPTGRRVLHLAGRQTGDAGARLHLRFVALFAAAAVLPALIVAFFFGALVTRGIDNWFNARVQTSVENSAKVANSYIQEQESYLSDHIRLMARDLNHAGPTTLTDSPIAFSQYLAGVAADNGFAAAYVLDGEGRVLARSEGIDGPTFLEPPLATFKDADAGGDEVEARPFERTDMLRALYRLRSFANAYLYVVRPVEHGVFAHLRDT